ASYNLEILDMEKNIPVPNGTLGRIVVTDFFNYCMPLIRFDTGDLGVMQTINGIDVLSKIVGRKSDVIFNTKNEEVTSLIALDFSMYKGLLEGQIIQNGAKEYVLKLHVDNAFDKEKELLEKFRLYFGEDALITINYVESIPLLKSGKRKLAINNYIKN
ncbi:MAG: CoF synthetase, partial [Mangrovimonas sp.]|nr:CoF synthetase [Mangrovimonas sp.]